MHLEKTRIRQCSHPLRRRRFHKRHAARKNAHPSMLSSPPAATLPQTACSPKKRASAGALHLLRRDASTNGMQPEKTRIPPALFIFSSSDASTKRHAARKNAHPPALFIFFGRDASINGMQLEKTRIRQCSHPLRRRRFHKRHAARKNAHPPALFIFFGRDASINGMHLEKRASAGALHLLRPRRFHKRHASRKNAHPPALFIFFGRDASINGMHLEKTRIRRRSIPRRRIHASEVQTENTPPADLAHGRASFRRECSAPSRSPHTARCALYASIRTYFIVLLSAYFRFRRGAAANSIKSGDAGAFRKFLCARSSRRPAAIYA